MIHSSRLIVLETPGSRSLEAALPAGKLALRLFELWSWGGGFSGESDPVPLSRTG